MPKLTLDEVVESSSPYLDVFGEETRGRGRPTGAALDYSTSLEMPSAKAVPDRRQAQQIRERVRRKALAVLQAVAAEELRKIYRAELVLELARIGTTDNARPAPADAPHRQLLSKDDAKKLPGSGLKPGETYWDWMKTYGEKDDAQWAQEKITVAANIAKVQRGNHG